MSEREGEGEGDDPASLWETADAFFMMTEFSVRRHIGKASQLLCKPVSSGSVRYFDHALGKFPLPATEGHCVLFQRSSAWMQPLVGPSPNEQPTLARN